MVEQSYSLLVLCQLVTSSTVHPVYSHGIGAISTRSVIGWAGSRVCRGIGLGGELVMGSLKYLLELSQQTGCTPAGGTHA